MNTLERLSARAGAQCELCGESSELNVLPVDLEDEDAAPEKSVLLCKTCRDGVTARDALEGSHWYCLQEAIWSETPAVQVLSYRLLHRLPGQGWATDLIDQVYLEDELLAWANAGLNAATEVTAQPLDCHGAPLSDGDSVTLIKDLNVKGANFTAKRGTLVKNIRVGEDLSHVEGRVNKMSIMLKTCFLKRVS